MIVHLVRILLTIALLFGVYSETGIWTTIAFALVFLGIELVTFTMRRMNATYSAALAAVESLVETLNGLPQARIFDGAITPKHFSPEVTNFIIQIVGNSFRNRRIKT